MFSIKDAIKYGWNKSKEHMELVLFSTFLVLAVASLKFSVLWFIGIIFLIILKIGYTKLFLRMYDGENPKLAEIFQEYKTFWRYLGASILFPIVVLLGLILIIIPGFIWAVRFSFSTLIVIDTKTGPIASMKESYAITKGNFWHLFLFWIAIIGINLLGAILLGIGLLVSIPVSTFAIIYVYRALSKARAAITETASPQSA